MHSFGRYQLLGEVGRGGVGVVRRALDPAGRPVALKLLLAGQAAPERQRRRFRREAEALLRIRHPGVVALLDAGEREGLPFLVMEWVEGESLEARLRREGPLDPRQAASLVRHLALALAHCHAQGVLHRDLKPDNVLLRAADGQPLLVDFGLARELEAEGGQSLLTRTGQALGTPGYWPPEQAEGRREDVGPAADVFGLGGLLFAALTAEPPHAGETAQQVLASLAAPPRPPSALRPGLPPALDALCVRCLARDPAERPGSAQAVADALEAWLEGRAADPLAQRERRWLLPLVALSAAAVALSSALVVIPGTSPSARPGTAAWVGTDGERPPPAGWAPPAAEDVGALVAAAEEALSRLDAAGALSAARQAARGAPEDPAVRALLAEALLRARELPDAEEEARLTLELAPEHPRALVILGEALIERGELAAALARGEEAARRYPDFPNAWALCARARLRGGDFEGAERDATRVLELAPGQPLALALRADARRRQGKLSEALADVDLALKVVPDLSGVWTTRGEIQLGLGRPEAAADDATRAIALDPNLGPAYMVRGRARERLGDRAAALPDLAKAVQVEPDNGEARLFLGDMLFLLGDLARARSEVERGIALDPLEEARGRLLLAKIAYLTPDLPGARQEVDRALELAPGTAQAWWLRAEIRRAQGDVSGSAGDAARAVALDPTSPDGHLSLAEASLQARELTAAQAQAARALELADDPRTRAQALFVVGSARHMAGDPQAALELANQAIEADPTLGRGWSLRADVQLDLQRLEEALADANRAVELAPGSADPWSIRGEIRRKRRDLQGAVEDATRSLAVVPSQRAYLTRALARLGSRDLAGCRDDAGQALALGGYMAPLAALIRGDAQRGLGERDAALADYRLGLELAPEGPYADQLRVRLEQLGAAR